MRSELVDGRLFVVAPVLDRRMLSALQRLHEGMPAITPVLVTSDKLPDYLHDWLAAHDSAWVHMNDGPLMLHESRIELTAGPGVDLDIQHPRSQTHGLVVRGAFAVVIGHCAQPGGHLCNIVLVTEGGSSTVHVFGSITVPATAPPEPAPLEVTTLVEVQFPFYDRFVDRSVDGDLIVHDAGGPRRYPLAPIQRVARSASSAVLMVEAGHVFVSSNGGRIVRGEQWLDTATPARFAGRGEIVVAGTRLSFEVRRAAGAIGRPMTVDDADGTLRYPATFVISGVELELRIRGEQLEVWRDDRQLALTGVPPWFVVGRALIGRDREPIAIDENVSYMHLYEVVFGRRVGTITIDLAAGTVNVSLQKSPSP